MTTTPTFTDRPAHKGYCAPMRVYRGADRQNVVFRDFIAIDHPIDVWENPEARAKEIADLKADPEVAALVATIKERMNLEGASANLHCPIAGREHTAKTMTPYRVTECPVNAEFEAMGRGYYENTPESEAEFTSKAVADLVNESEIAEIRRKGQEAIIAHLAALDDAEVFIREEKEGIADFMKVSAIFIGIVLASAAVAIWICGGLNP